MLNISRSTKNLVELNTAIYVSVFPFVAFHCLCTREALSRQNNCPLTLLKGVALQSRPVCGKWCDEVCVSFKTELLFQLKILIWMYPMLWWLFSLILSCYYCNVQNHTTSRMEIVLLINKATYEMALEALYFSKFWSLNIILKRTTTWIVTYFF